MNRLLKAIVSLTLALAAGSGLLVRPGVSGQVPGQEEAAELIQQIFQGRPIPASEKLALDEILAAGQAAESRRFESALATLDKVLADYDKQAGALSSDPKGRQARLQRLSSFKRGMIIIALGFRAEVLSARGDLDRAFSDYDLAVNLAPDEIPALLLNRALCQMRRKNYEQAEADLNTVIASKKPSAQTVVALKLRGDVYLEQSLFDEAIDDYTLALDLVPQEQNLLQALENARSKKKAAYEDLQRTIESFISKKDEELKKAEAELTAAKSVKAKVAALAKRAAVHRDMNHYEECEADYTALTVLDPNNPRWYKNRGDLRENLPRGQQGAVDDYTLFLKLAPGTVDVYSGRGRAYDRLGKHDLAVFDFDQALKLKPGDDAILYWRGLAKMSLGNPQAAIRDYSAALAANPNKAVYFKDRAEAYEKLKQYGPAIEDGTSAIALAPNDPSFYILRGDLRRKTKEYDESLADLNKALELDPESSSALGVRADTYFYKGDYRNAVTDYTTFLAKNPNSSLAYYRRGRAYLELQRYGEAVADFKKSVELNPELLDGLNSLAWILATCPKSEIRNGPEAVAYAQKALDLAGGEDYFLMDTLATALAEAGRFEEAVALQEKAVSLIPADADKTERSDMEKRLALFRRGKPFREK